MSAWTFELLPWADAPWPVMQEQTDFMHCKSQHWLDFVRRSQGAEPVVASISRDGNVCGYFVGAVIKKLGMRILGSPFPGWTTSHMGIIATDPSLDRASCYAALLPDLSKRLGCIYAQVLDVELECDAADAAGLNSELSKNQFIDLTQTEDELFANLSSACRRAIRKGRKNELRVVETTDPSAFATEYYKQLLDVFKKQSLVPTYDEARVHELISSVYPSGNLLLLETRDQNDQCVATGLFPGSKRMMEFWGGASYREFQNARPNEILFFEAMKIWKSRGTQLFDLGGYSEYKEKFGPQTRVNPYVVHARWATLHAAKSFAQKAYAVKQRMKGARVSE